MRLNFKKDGLVKKILLGIAEAMPSGGMLVSKNEISPIVGSKKISELAEWYLNQHRQKRYRVRKILSVLKAKGLIIFTKNENNSLRIGLTEAGRKFTLRYKLDSMEIPLMSRWDKKWRLVIFNIPENLKAARQTFSKKLEELKFFPIQKAVWVNPYECRKEIETIAKILEIKNYIRLIEAVNLDDEEQIKKYFPGFLN